MTRSTFRIARRTACAALALLAFAPLAGFAQSTYPSRPIKLIVPFATGGGVDSIARLLGEKLSQRLGQPIVVENKPGAGTTIGNQLVARSAPDGYTLLMASSSFTTGPSLSRSLPYSIERDFAPVIIVANSPAVLVVNVKSDANTLPQLVAKAKVKPGALTSATYGSGSTPHLVSELFQQLSGTKFLSVPYSGGGPAMLSTLSGETDMVFPTVLPALPHVKSGKVKVLAIASAKRSALLPDVQTFQEQGVPLVTGTWFGVVAPASTPAAIVERLNSEVLAIAKEDAAFIKKLNDEGAEFAGGTPGEFGAFIKLDQERWRKVIAESGIKAE
jgi:tripartite-type tricarboxylate transporter receptor subunit TctC